MMTTIRIGQRGDLFGVGTGLLSIHAIAGRGGKANGCHVGIEALSGRWVQGHLRTGLRWWRHFDLESGI